jgi:hypothetical protein
MPDRTAAAAAQAGARPVRGERPKRRGLWLLLGLLALAAIIAILLIALIGGDDDSQSASAGTLKSGDRALLPVPRSGLRPLVGQTVTGDGVRVQSVVRHEGFWVGTSATDRVYVEYGGRVGENEANAFTPRVGQSVTLTGPVRPAPADPARTLKLGAADARLVSREGGFVNAARVQAAQS